MFDVELLRRLHDDFGFRFVLCSSEPGEEKKSARKDWLTQDDYAECMQQVANNEKVNIGAVSSGDYLVVDYDMYKDSDRSRRIRYIEKPIFYAGDEAPPIFLTPRGGMHVPLAIPPSYKKKKFKKTHPNYPYIDLIRPGKDKFMLPGNEVVLEGGEFGEYKVYKPLPARKVYASYDFLESWIDEGRVKPSEQVHVSNEILDVWLNGDGNKESGLPASEFSDYEKWIKILFAAHAATDGSGLDVFVKWSRSDPANDNMENERLIRYKWSTCSAHGGITFGTIVAAYDKLGLPHPKIDESGEGILAELERDKKGRVVCTARNLSLIFDHDPFLKDRFRHNLLGGVDLWLPPDSKDGKYVPFDFDSHTFPIRDYLLAPPYNMRTITKAIIGDEAQRKASHHKFHPLKTHLESLQWDGRKRLKNWLSVMGGAEDNIYTRELSFLTLYAAVKRVYEPGCHYHYVLVLQGKQGIGKSSMVEILAGKPEYYLSNLNPDLNEARNDIQGKWFVEIAEGLALTKREANELKQFFTTATDTYRKKYGKVSMQHARTCLFIATTNRKDLLDDETGSRRYCCVPLEKISLKKLRTWRDQLFAEAHEAYLENPNLPLQLTKKAQQIQLKHAVQHARVGAMHEVIMMALDDPNIVTQVNNYGYITYMSMVEAVKDAHDRQGWSEPKVDNQLRLEIDRALIGMEFTPYRLEHRGRAHRTYTPNDAQMQIFQDKGEELKKSKDQKRTKH